eukprot:7375903-Prymnesium_polylepis.2
MNGGSREDGFRLCVARHLLLHLVGVHGLTEGVGRVRDARWCLPLAARLHRRRQLEVVLLTVELSGDSRCIGFEARHPRLQVGSQGGVIARGLARREPLLANGRRKRRLRFALPRRNRAHLLVGALADGIGALRVRGRNRRQQPMTNPVCHQIGTRLHLVKKAAAARDLRPTRPIEDRINNNANVAQ